MKNACNPASSHPYFGYGSNLNIAHLARLCERAGIDPSGIRPLGPAILPDMHLAFNFRSSRWGGGVLNVVPLRGAIVHGYLFDLSPDVWRLFDAKEGHPDVYRRRDVNVLLPNGSCAAGSTYIVTEERAGQFVAPAPDYLAICKAGREQLGLDINGLETAARGETCLLDSLFCYGTLMRGELRFPAVRRHGIVCALLAEATGTLLDHGSYPGLALGREHSIRGDFFRSSDIGGLLRELDRIEGFAGFGHSGNLFTRTVTDIHVGNGRVRRAWIYATCNTGATLLEPQDWRGRHGRASAMHEAVVAAHLESAPDLFERMSNAANWFSRRPPETCFRYDREVVLADLARGLISERDLAQASGLWTAATAG